MGGDGVVPTSPGASTAGDRRGEGQQCTGATPTAPTLARAVQRWPLRNARWDPILPPPPRPSRVAEPLADTVPAHGKPSRPLPAPDLPLSSTAPAPPLAPPQPTPWASWTATTSQRAACSPSSSEPGVAVLACVCVGGGGPGALAAWAGGMGGGGGGSGGLMGEGEVTTSVRKSLRLACR